MRSLIAIATVMVCAESFATRAPLAPSVTANAGSLDGKSIVCTEILKTSVEGKVIGFKFQDGKVYGKSIIERDLRFTTDVVGGNKKDRNYKETRSEVEW